MYFSSQEPGTNEEIKKFATEKYGVKFDLFSKINVNGDTAHPLYKYLKNKQSGFLVKSDILFTMLTRTSGMYAIVKNISISVLSNGILPSSSLTRVANPLFDTVPAQTPTSVFYYLSVGIPETGVTTDIMALCLQDMRKDLEKYFAM